ncbi:MAG: DMT family transporter [Candidatus Thorarchaeota archaeon]|jgi:drug/metabolite transporter (DMT)-like permease
MTTRNWLLFLCSALLWGLSWSVVKVALGYVTPLIFSFHQSLIVTIVLIPFVFVTQKPLPRDRNTLLHLLVYGLVNGVNVVVSNTGLAGESSGIGAMLTFTQPLLVFLLSVVFLHESVKVGKLVGVLVGLIGVSILSIRPDVPFYDISPFSVLLVFGAFLWASSTIYYKKFLVQVNVIVTTALQFTIGSGMLGLLSVLVDGTVPLNFGFEDPLYLGLLLFNTLAVSVFGTIIWLFLLGRETATNLSTYGFLIPVIALIIGWGVLGEPLSLQSLLGSSLILVSMYTVQRDSSSTTQDS